MITRIVSAIVMAVLLTLVIFYAPVIIFNAIVLLIIMGGLYEFFKLALPNDPIYRETGWIFGIVISAAILFFSSQLGVFLSIVIGGIFIVSLIYMYHSTTLEGITSRIAITLLGALYLGATLPFWALLRELPHGACLYGNFCNCDDRYICNVRR